MTISSDTNSDTIALLTVTSSKPFSLYSYDERAVAESSNPPKNVGVLSALA
jgi:hypothetical protein